MTPDRQRLAIEERIALQEGRGSLGREAAAALAALRADLAREEREEEERRLGATLSELANGWDSTALPEWKGSDLDALLKYSPEDLSRLLADMERDAASRPCAMCGAPPRLSARGARP